MAFELITPKIQGSNCLICLESLEKFPSKRIYEIDEGSKKESSFSSKIRFKLERIFGLRFSRGFICENCVKKIKRIETNIAALRKVHLQNKQPDRIEANVVALKEVPLQKKQAVKQLFSLEQAINLCSNLESEAQESESETQDSSEAIQVVQEKNSSAQVYPDLSSKIMPMVLPDGIPHTHNPRVNTKAGDAQNPQNSPAIPTRSRVIINAFPCSAQPHGHCVDDVIEGVKCTKCKAWSHLKCAGFDLFEAANVDPNWMCWKCKQIGPPSAPKAAPRLDSEALSGLQLLAAVAASPHAQLAATPTRPRANYELRCTSQKFPVHASTKSFYQSGLSQTSPLVQSGQMSTSIEILQPEITISTNMFYKQPGKSKFVQIKPKKQPDIYSADSSHICNSSVKQIILPTVMLEDTTDPLYINDHRQSDQNTDSIQSSKAPTQDTSKAIQVAQFQTSSAGVRPVLSTRNLPMLSEVLLGNISNTDNQPTVDNKAEDYVQYPNNTTRAKCVKDVSTQSISQSDTLDSATAICLQGHGQPDQISTRTETQWPDVMISANMSDMQPESLGFGVSSDSPNVLPTVDPLHNTGHQQSDITIYPENANPIIGNFPQSLRTYSRKRTSSLTSSSPKLLKTSISSPNEKTPTTRQCPANTKPASKLSHHTPHSYAKKEKGVKRIRRKLIPSKPRPLMTKLEEMGKKQYRPFLANVSTKIEQAICSGSRRSTSGVVRALFRIPEVKQGLEEIFCEEIHNYPNTLKKTTILCKTEMEDLQSCDLEKVANEFVDNFGFLANLMVSFMVPPNKQRNAETLSGIIPIIAVIYGMLMKTRNPNLNLIQKVLSMVLVDSSTEQVGFDRLNKIAICMSHGTSMGLLNDLSETVEKTVAEKLKAGKKVRLIGDNVNLAVKAQSESLLRRNRTLNLFGSAFICQNDFFENEPLPKCPQVSNPTPADILPSCKDANEYQHNSMILIAKIWKEFFPQLSFLSDIFPDHIGNDDRKFAEETEVFPTGVINKNEMKATDVVDILEKYTQDLKTVYKIADKNINKANVIHIGGDQLTRERFSMGINTRLANPFPEKLLSGLGRVAVTMEFFHLDMNFLQMIYKHLSSNNAVTITEVGTIEHAIARLSRTQVNYKKLTSHYDACKDLFLTFWRSLLVTASLEFFGMTNLNDAIASNCPPLSQDPKEREDWAKQALSDFLTKLVMPTKQNRAPNIVKMSEHPMAPTKTLILSNGKAIEVSIMPLTEETHGTQEPDRKMNYCQTVLRLGLHYHYFQELVKRPNRDQMLTCLKMILPVYKALSPAGKYPFEVFRFIVQQLILDFDAASEVFYGCFVNTKGGLNTHVPADLAMEWQVKRYKRCIKKLGSKSCDDTIYKRTKAIGATSHIVNRFDEQIHKRTRQHGSANRNARVDEETLISEFSQIRPFYHTPGRHYTKFQNITKTPTDKLDGPEFNEWMCKHLEKGISVS
jgi:hypothetical protein